MKRAELNIGHIPALLWGETSDRLIIAVHGNLSHKADTVIALLAQQAVAQGYQVLSFDLPQHGERKDEPTLCKAQTCVEELQSVMAYAMTLTTEISLFGCSIGAYFSLLAYCNEPLKQALFLSPVVDMERLIGNMMTWFSVSEERLQTEGEVSTPLGRRSTGTTTSTSRPTPSIIGIHPHKSSTAPPTTSASGIPSKILPAASVVI